MLNTFLGELSSQTYLNCNDLIYRFKAVVFYKQIPVLSRCYFLLSYDGGGPGKFGKCWENSWEKILEFEGLVGRKGCGLGFSSTNFPENGFFAKRQTNLKCIFL